MKTAKPMKCIWKKFTEDWGREWKATIPCNSVIEKLSWLSINVVILIFGYTFFSKIQSHCRDRSWAGKMWIFAFGKLCKFLNLKNLLEFLNSVELMKGPGIPLCELQRASNVSDSTPSLRVGVLKLTLGPCLGRFLKPQAFTYCSSLSWFFAWSDMIRILMYFVFHPWTSSFVLPHWYVCPKLPSCPPRVSPRPENWTFVPGSFQSQGFETQEQHMSTHMFHGRVSPPSCWSCFLVRFVRVIYMGKLVK